MTVTSSSKAGAAPEPSDLVAVTIDGVEVEVPKGTLVIRAAEQIGVAIPRFCDHPLLAPAGACRQCLVEVELPDREGNLRAMPKPQASCTLTVSPGMVVKTQHSSPVAEKAQHGVMELLLINHPLDCPVCDKGGECPLQNQAMTNGREETRFIDAKRTYAKPLSISTQVLLDRERCILCQRCTRFSDEIAGDPFIDLQERGAKQQIGVFDTEILHFEGDAPMGDARLDASGRRFSSYFSGNTIQICPVGALTSAAYRFRSRPFDLVSTPAIAEHDANGSAIRIDKRRNTVLRRLSGEDAVVNEEWITDKDRFAFTWQTAPDRLTSPLVRDRAEDGTRGELRPASWPEALEVAGAALAAARDAKGVGVLPGGRLTLEDAYAYAKFARVVLGTNDVDHRARAHSAEEAQFLAHAVAARGVDVTFADLESATNVLLVGLEAEEEGGVVFLRLRKGATAGRTKVSAVAPFASSALQRMRGTLIQAAPGTEAEVLDALEADVVAGGIVLAGERLAEVPGALSAALRLVERTGARLAWIPRRIGERTGVEAGTLPGLLPGGRPVADSAARVDTAAEWGVESLPATEGRDTTGILAAAAAGELSGLVVGGLELDDLPDPALAREALAGVDVVVSLETRASAVHELADVVLPVAVPSEKAGTYVNWEGRLRGFGQALDSNAMPDYRVLASLADEMDVDLGLATADVVHAELAALGHWDGARTEAPQVAASPVVEVGPGQAVLATWRLLLDLGRGQDGEQFLAGTAKRPVARLSAATAQAVGVSDGEDLAVGTEHGTITLPALVTDMVDHVVWVPGNSPGSQVRATLRTGAGSVVTVARATAEVTA